MRVLSTTIISRLDVILSSDARGKKFMPAQIWLYSAPTVGAIGIYRPRAKTP